MSWWGVGLGVAGLAVNLWGNKKSTEQQEDASKRAQQIAADALIAQREIIGETKEEIEANNLDLLEFAKKQGMDIETALIDASFATVKVLYEGLRDAQALEEVGLEAAAYDLTKGIRVSTDFLLKGEQGAADQAIKAINNAREEYQKTKTEANDMYSPWIDNGVWATEELKNRADELTRQFTLDDFKVDPGYKERLEKGQEAIVHHGSAIGVTGGTAKDLVDYSQAVASDEIGKAFIRFRDFQENTENYLKDISNQGKDATTQYLEIAQRVNENTAGLDLEEGNVLSNLARNKGIIQADAATKTSEIESGLTRDLALSKAGLIRDRAGINAKSITDIGNIKANTLQSYLDLKAKLVQQENALGSYLSGAELDAVKKYADDAATQAVSQGDIGAGSAINQANAGTDFLGNIGTAISTQNLGGGSGGLTNTLQSALTNSISTDSLTSIPSLPSLPKPSFSFSL